MGLISKSFTFSPGATIVSSEHNTNFDTLYNVINANLTNANINTSAGIVASKLDLSTISQAIAMSGNLTLSGAANDFSGATFSDGGTVTTIDINGGTIDGTTVGASSASTGVFTDCSSTFYSLPETTAPTVAASEGALYTKDTSGQPELFFREESDGDEVQITTAGALNAPTPDVFLLSATTVTTSANSGNITIAASKIYLVEFEFIQNASSGEIGLRFNSDATGYAYCSTELNMGTTETQTLLADDSHTHIRVTGSDTGAGQAISGSFRLDTTKKNGDSAFVRDGVSVNHDGSTYYETKFSGVYLDDTTITDLEFFVAAGTLTGKVYVYEYALS